MNENEIEVSAKSVDAAVAEGLQLLDTTIDNVSIEILSQGGFFKKAKVRMSIINSGNEKKPDDNRKEKQPQPEKKPQAEKQPQPEKKPQAEKQPQPEKKPQAEKQPQPEKKPQAEKQPQPEKKPQAEKQPQPEKKPQTERQPQPERKPQPERQPQPERKPQPERQPQPEKKPQPVKSPIEQSKQNEKKDEVVDDVTDKKPKKEITPEIIASAQEFLKGLFERMNLNVEVKCNADQDLNIELISPEVPVIGYRGETLDAIEHLVSGVINKGEGYIHVNVDSNNYRQKREKMLIEMAHKKADKCIKTGKKVVLEPMNNTSRKIIHYALSDNDKVVTRSDGKEPNRRVIIYPKRTK